MKLKSEHGFVDIVLAILIVIAVGVAGYYGYLRYQNSRPVTNPAPVAAPTNNNGWSTFKSSASSVQLSYPSSWNMTRNQPGSQYDLENVTFSGPDNFVLAFDLEKDHPNPALSCAFVRRQAPIKLGNGGWMALEGTSAYFETDQNTAGGSGCSLGFNYIQLGQQIGFILKGSYQSEPTGGEQALQFQDRPEVKTAEQIFASVKF